MISKEEPTNKKRDSISFHFPPLMRQRLEALPAKIGNGMTSVVLRNVALLGLAQVEYAVMKGLPLPFAERNGVAEISTDFEKWLTTVATLLKPEEPEVGELKDACVKLGVEPPEKGRVAVWLLDLIAPEVGNAAGIGSVGSTSQSTDWGSSALEEIALARELVEACEDLEISPPISGSVKLWLSAFSLSVLDASKTDIQQMTSELALAEEFIAACQTLLLPPPTQGNVAPFLVAIASGHMAYQEFLISVKAAGLPAPDPGKMDEWLDKYARPAESDVKSNADFSNPNALD